MGYLFSLILIILSVASKLNAAQNIKISARFLDILIRNYSVQSYGNKYTTGKFHSVELPTNFSSIKVHTSKFRCGSLRRYGARINNFSLPPGVIIQACIERVLLVIQNLGFNWSPIYYTSYNLSGYELVSPVLGLFAYNAGTDSGLAEPFEVGVQAGRQPIIVNFKNITRVPQGSNTSTAFCANFDRNGNMTLLKQASPYVCYAEKHGHFGLVVAESRAPPSRPLRGRKRANLSGWRVAVGSTIGAGLGAFLLGLLLIAMLVKVKKKQSRIEELERRAYEEEALQVSMVGHVRAPRANGTRTVPTMQI